MNEQQFIAIGDIHGCLRSMEALLEKLETYKDRKFVFVGDYIDRGPNSREVVDRLLDLRNEVDTVFLRGNHEQMLLDAVHKDKRSMWMMNGGRTTLQSYGIDNELAHLPDEHIQFYENTQMYYNTDNYFFVHAGLSPAKTISQSIKEEDEVKEFLWERSHLKTIETAWEKIVVFGHTPTREPVQRDMMIGIDTGCVYSRSGYGKLTAVKLPEVEFIQQDCLD
ncbi:metallophosphoesterase family protein [Fodinibius saliphilus]|uniref:metallophosphoesterase family protein n=1 Tax=Fodinibius saliphilus TaxID=1920650 RepID=UPI001BB2A295|nr:metallophosphoesterase family protein [Fodinibius saliphilus]